MSTINSHNEEVFRDGEPRESSPGTCPCCGDQERDTCGDCGFWLDCGICGESADCTCPAEAETADDEEETSAIPVETMQQLVFGRSERKAA